MKLLNVAPHSLIVEVYGHEFYVPLDTKYIAISDSGIAVAFKHEPTYMEPHKSAPGRWFDYMGRDEGHIVAQFDLENTKPRNTLFKVGENNGRIEG